MKNRMIRFVQECLRLKHVLHNFNKTFIFLIPKTKQPSNFNHYRPINLCNFVYKIVSKIIIERMRSILKRIVSLNQWGFVEGRWIAENIVIAQEVISKVKKHKGKKGLIAINVDLNKAYDRIEWKILDWTLEA